MLKSHFTIAIYFVFVGTLFMVVGGSYLIISEFKTSNSWIGKLLCLIPILWMWLVIIGREIRRKCIVISIENLSINITSLFFKRIYDIVYFDGFKTCTIYTSGKTYEEIYLMKNEKHVVTISSFYISNYAQIKIAIESKFIFKGLENYSLKKDMMQIFK